MNRVDGDTDAPPRLIAFVGGVGEIPGLYERSELGAIGAEAEDAHPLAVRDVEVVVCAVCGDLFRGVH